MHNQYSEAKEMHKEWEKRHLCIMTPGGIKTETGGIDPTWGHPKPRPTTPRNLFANIIMQYQKENCHTRKLREEL